MSKEVNNQVKVIANFSGDVRDKNMTLKELAENADQGITMSKLGRSITDSDLHYYWLLCQEFAKYTQDFKISYYNVETLNKCRRKFQSNDDKIASKKTSLLKEVKYTFNGKNLTNVEMTFESSQQSTLIEIGQICFSLSHFIKQILKDLLPKPKDKDKKKSEDKSKKEKENSAK